MVSLNNKQILPMFYEDEKEVAAVEDRSKASKSLFATASRSSALLTKHRRGGARVRYLAEKSEVWGFATAQFSLF